MLIPPDHLDEEPSILARIREGEAIEQYQTVRRRKDGTLLNVSLTVSPVRDSDGHIVGASKIARDISHRKRNEDALRQAQAPLLDAQERADFVRVWVEDNGIGNTAIARKVFAEINRHGAARLILAPL